MGRPQPEIVLADADRQEDVLPAEAIFAVYYNGAPINLRIATTNGWRYRRTCHSSSGFAFNLRDRLNRQFDTNRFQVYRLMIDVLLLEAAEPASG